MLPDFAAVQVALGVAAKLLDTPDGQRSTVLVYFDPERCGFADALKLALLRGRPRIHRDALPRSRAWADRQVRRAADCMRGTIADYNAATGESARVAAQRSLEAANFMQRRARDAAGAGALDIQGVLTHALLGENVERFATSLRLLQMCGAWQPNAILAQGAERTRRLLARAELVLPRDEMRVLRGQLQEM